MPCKKCGNIEESMDGLCSKCRTNGYFHIDFNPLGEEFNRLIVRVSSSDMFVIISTIKIDKGVERLSSSFITFFDCIDKLIETLGKIKKLKEEDIIKVVGFFFNNVPKKKKRKKRVRNE